jgi:D-glycerate 3-kinase
MFKFSNLTLNVVMFPLIDKIEKKFVDGKTAIIGFQAGIGLGKSTWVEYIKKNLKSKGYKVQSFSIDDFYLSNAKRRKLAEKYNYNAFYQISRGMPGTHRLKDLKKVLRNIKSGKNFVIPNFDKSLNNGEGDVTDKSVEILERQDFVLFEGWCIGLPEVSDGVFLKICKNYGVDIKKLDPTGSSREVLFSYVKKYQPLWKYLDYLIMMVPDSLSIIGKWRNDQERELKAKKGSGMTPEEVKRFVEMYLPLTFVCYDRLKPDVTLISNDKHEFYDIK